jgi:hypothetical protein
MVEVLKQGEVCTPVGGWKLGVDIMQGLTWPFP